MTSKNQLFNVLRWINNYHNIERDNNIGARNVNSNGGNGSKSAQLQSKLKHLSFFMELAKVRIMSKVKIDEFCQLVTSITTHTAIKSFYFGNVFLDRKGQDFLRFWYKDPFGYCDMQLVDIDENELQTKAGRIRKNKLMKRARKDPFVLIAQFESI